MQRVCQVEPYELNLLKNSKIFSIIELPTDRFDRGRDCSVPKMGQVEIPKGLILAGGYSMR